MPAYRKVFQRLWDDEGFRVLSHFQMLIALYVLTGAQTNRIGLFVFSIARAAEHLKVSETRLRKSLADVCKTFGWKWDPRARVIYLPTWWKYNPPANADHLKGCLSDLVDLPKTPLVEDFKANVHDLPTAHVGAFKQIVGQGFKSAPDTMSHTVSPIPPDTLPHTRPTSVSEAVSETETGAVSQGNGDGSLLACWKTLRIPEAYGLEGQLLSLARLYGEQAVKEALAACGVRMRTVPIANPLAYVRTILENAGAAGRLANEALSVLGAP